jgi:hypothetical protein
MKGPPEHVEQITADRLREVIVGLKCPAPSKNELSEMAAAYAAMQLFDRDPKVELASEPGVSARNIVTGKVRVTNVPVHLRHVVARGATKHWKQKNWSDRAPDIAAPFRRAMKGVDPNLPLRDRDGPVARFVAAVIPLIFPGQHPSVSAVGQVLARKTRARL